MKKTALTLVILLPFFLFAQRINTFLGGTNSDLKKATEQSVNPGAITADENGNLLVAGGDRNVIWRVENNRLYVIAGTTLAGYSGDGGPATAANFFGITAIFYDKRTHSIYVADQFGTVIRKIDAMGFVNTIAGTSQDGYSGDGGPAVQAEIYVQKGLFVDRHGNVFLAQRSNNVIRKIDTAGNISTIAGNGTNGFSGDGGQALAAQLNQPNGVYVDTLGKIYISDGYNFRIRRIAANGVIETVAGNGEWDFTGAGSTAINTAIGYVPGNVDFDALGNMYLVCQNANRVLKINSNSTVEVFAGNGAEYTGEGVLATDIGFTIPLSIISNGKGDFFIASDNRVHQVTTNLHISMVAGNGDQLSSSLMPAQEAQLFQPKGGVFKQNGDFIFRSGRYILQYSTSGWLTLISGSYRNSDSSVSSTHYFDPGGITLGFDKKGNLYYWEAFRVRKITPDGFIKPVAGLGSPGTTGDGGLATSAKIHVISGFAEDSIGNLYLADLLENRIRKIDTNGIISTYAGNGSATNNGDSGLAISAGLYWPESLRFDKKGNLLVSCGQSYVRMISPQGIIRTVAGNGTNSSSGDGGLATMAGLVPVSLVVNEANEILVADQQNGNIRKIDTAGIISTIAGGGSSYVEDVLALGTKLSPSQLTLASDGDLIVCEPFNHRIRKIHFPILWIGSVNDNWEEPANWNNGKIPGPVDDVVINSGTVVVNSNITVKGLRLSPGVNFTVAPGYTVTVTN